MRYVFGLLALVTALAGTAQAQVINGEGTYEGSSLHNPPPEAKDARVDDQAPADHDRASREPGRGDR